MPGKKKCARCREEQPLESFHRDRKSKDLRQPYCKKCVLEYRRSKRKAEREGRAKALKKGTAKCAQFGTVAKCPNPDCGWEVTHLIKDGTAFDELAEAYKLLKIEHEKLKKLMEEANARARARVTGKPLDHNTLDADTSPVDALPEGYDRDTGPGF